ncbi:hypothetical protein TcasGA2_TC010289 [Tribolium castaneum]|uniref:Uncharacterized protein n=1 Tax=Tribolium castaneum TaxID=7070 RepID=D7EJI5_TRICA|nr:hypothetical protein TcasGA2_TC010289 [Tribolium castaneum]
MGSRLDRFSFTHAAQLLCITTNQTPITTKVHRFPKIHKQIAKMLKQGIIKDLVSPYKSPLWIVPKKADAFGAKKWRIVVDYRKLNDVTVGDSYPLPNIESILDQVGHPKYLTLDLVSGFHHQIPMKKEDAPKTASSTPFGLKNSPVYFKVVTIFGIFGACRCDELLSLTPNDVEDTGKYIIVTLRNTKNFTTRRFTITDEECRFQPCFLYRKYASLRPTQAESLRLFLTYRGGKCISLNVGQHTIGGIPKKIASYLKLSEPELYTGHSFRRTAATMVVDSGGDILALKRAGGWKSSAVAEGYVEDSIKQKLERAKKLFLVPEPTSAFSSSKHASTVSEETSKKFNVSGNQNCNITINVYSREINPVNNE